MTHLSRSLATVATVAVAATGSFLASAGDAAAEIIPEDLGDAAGGLTSGALPTVLDTATGATRYAVGPALDLQLNPMANTTTDPLSNSAGTQIADFRPISTDIVTGPLAEGASTRELPGALLGGVLGLLGQGQGQSQGQG
jgi:hypothetical protein